MERRYTRSVNLERDYNNAEILDGYVITERAGQALHQISEAIIRQDSVSAWTLTGVYGTGKSSFAHFLTALFGSKNSEVKRIADSIVENNSNYHQTLKTIASAVSGDGFVRSVATAQREPLEKTILRSLKTGINSFWKPTSKIGKKFNGEIDRIEKKSIPGTTNNNSSAILNLISQILEKSKVGMLLIIDEFGKSLEYAAINRKTDDLYLLQQIKELSVSSKTPLFLFGLLHQAFSEYGLGLGMVERNEWVKIQGRFEEIPFTESSRQMLYLTGQAITHSFEEKQKKKIDELSKNWNNKLQKVIETEIPNIEYFRRVLPLHPLSALVLPQLCIRYAQNDRSLFTFLNGAEFGSLRTFLDESEWSDKTLPLLKLDRLYDYFVDTALAGLIIKPGFQRWTEVKNLIDEHLSDDPDHIRLLKTIGVLNLAATTGFLRAGRQIVSLAMCDEPDNVSELDRINQMIDRFIEKGVLTYRRQVDELRLWEGSDFDIEEAIKENIGRQQISFSEKLSEIHPLRPVVAQRHSYSTGATRIFEQRYFEDTTEFENLSLDSESGDGLIGYWLSESEPDAVLPETIENKPFVLIKVGNLETLRLRLLEFAALKEIYNTAPELQTDGVARREVRFRLLQSQNQFDDAFISSVKSDNEDAVWIDGKFEKLNLRKRLNSRLSDLMDEVYKSTPVIWNEHINRQSLTSQGAKASRQVISAMLENGDQKQLGFEGFGSEVSVYNSVLERTGIHRKEKDNFVFLPPEDQSIKPVWDEIDRFCLDAKMKPVNLEVLFEKLQQPPFGVKKGLIPILFAAVLINRSDDTSLYNDGVFIPVLGTEHFELLVKNPSRFSVKSYFITGVQAKVFKELENVFSETAIKFPKQMRNKNLLGIVTPLLKFARNLPRYTRQTSNLSTTAKAVRDALLKADEPDRLIFELLPEACGLEKIVSPNKNGKDIPRKFRIALVLALKELSEARAALLIECRNFLYEAFGVRQDIAYLREDLCSRSSYFTGRSIEPILTRFISDATNIAASDEEWLENIIMGIADKPIDSWSDTDPDNFGLKLSDLSRRFKHLEAIIKNNDTLWHSRAEARRVSIIRTDGSELHDIAWINENEKQILENKADEIIENLPDDKFQQKALLAIVTEKILDIDYQIKNKKIQPIHQQTEEENETYIRSVRRKR